MRKINLKQPLRLLRFEIAIARGRGEQRQEIGNPQIWGDGVPPRKLRLFRQMPQIKEVCI